MHYCVDLREYLDLLRAKDKLVTIERNVVKETEVCPLVRLEFVGLPEEKRKGFLFENVVDTKGRRYHTRLATGIYAPSTQIYALGLGSEPTKESIDKVWQHALLHPVQPKMIGAGPVQETVLQGDVLDKEGQGIESLPVPVEVPGYSGQIRTTTHIITKDPETGIRNMGNYSGHIFGKRKILWEIGSEQHGFYHYRAWKKLGKPMPAAIVVGGPPSFFYLAGAKIPYGVDELSVAGGFSGNPVELVNAKTIDLEVPAHAEIVIEGLMSTEDLEPGNAFGEYTGYMATDVEYRPVFNIAAITYRRDPIFVHVMSQFPPSESSTIRKISLENVFYKFLRHDCHLAGVLDVAWHEMSQGKWCVIKMRKLNNAQPWQVLNCASGYDTFHGKYIIVVDEDIDPYDLDSVIWAMSWRVQPSRDVRIITGRIGTDLDPSGAKPDSSYEEKEYPNGIGNSSILINATTKWAYPPISLPKKEYMEKALVLWNELGLGELKLKQPWYGYSLGYWPEQYEEDAQLVLKGEHYKVGERLEKNRKKA